MPQSANAELGALFEEVVALYHRLTADAALIYQVGTLSGPRRTVLMTVARSGPQTVAHMARARAQSRQRLQPLVNGLLDQGLVEAQSNPVHERSPLIALTAKGARTVEQMAATESALRARLRPACSPDSLARATAVLRDVRSALEKQLPSLVRDFRRRTRAR